MIPCSIVLDGETVLPAVWAMKRKRQVQTRDIYKYKAWLNIDGSKMRPGVHYNQTHAPVLAWGFIMILLSTVIRNNWKTMHIDYVLNFPWAPVNRGCYFNIQKVIEVQSDTKWVLKVKKNIYGQRQAGRVWNKFIVGKLTSSAVGLRQIKID